MKLLFSKIWFREHTLPLMSGDDTLGTVTWWKHASEFYNGLPGITHVTALKRI